MHTEHDLTTLVAENPALRRCASTTQGALLQQGSIRSFEDGSLLYGEGDPGGVVIFLLSGSLQMIKSTSRGRRQIVCNPHSTTCGGVCLLLFGERGMAEVRGVEPGQILVVPRERFEPLTQQDPVFSRAAWDGAAECMARLHHLVSQLSFSKVAERVITLLLEDTSKDGDMVRMTQSELAANVGTTREVVARCLAGLQVDGLIRLGRARVTVLDRERLRMQM